ncbi:DgyrCDS3763 [Dimorphilus gyrociliatus]|uniref:DgyrCDS3763 n=1 Tax=Dimorphilus gyrociliatus TaxID=2664684 RepID=A0A7I8VG98_9ANNE|nr:DgyrCDS3763 [Dimorphilus gyrociliatus]
MASPTDAGPVQEVATDQYSPTTDDKDKLILGKNPERSELSPLQIQDCNQTPQPPSETLKILIVSSIIFSVGVTVALILTIYLGPPQVEPTGAVVCDVPKCSDLGRKILEDGGSAVDAAVTTTLCVGLVDAQFSGVGGGGFMVVRKHKQDVNLAIDFRETAPGKTTKEMFKGKENSLFKNGLSVAVPGEIKGLYEAHQKFGQKSWKDVVMPVVKLARDGFEATADMIRVLEKEKDLIKNTYADPQKHLRTNYFNGENIIKKGDKIKRTVFANVLEKVALNGPDAFYKGPIAENIVSAVNKSGGIMTLSDLANYKVKTYVPVTSEFLGNILHMPSFPSGSPATALILNILKKYKLKKADKKDPLFYHRFIEATKFARSLWLNKSGDLMNNEEPKHLVTSVFLNETVAERLKDLINDNSTNDEDFYKFPNEPLSFGTSHISVIGPSEDLVSLTTTINMHFGAGVVTKDDVILNNEMADFSIPGLHEDEFNFPEPFKRPRSAMAPVILRKKDSQCGLRLSVGGVNGSRIFPGVGQVISNIVGLQMNISEAIKVPRLFPVVTTRVVEYDRPDEIGGLKEALEKKGHKLKIDNNGVNLVNLAGKLDEDIIGYADPRRAGKASVF